MKNKIKWKNLAMTFGVFFLATAIAVNADVQMDCADPLLPDSIIAGNSYTMECELDNTGSGNKGIDIVFEVVCEESVEKGEFSLSASIDSESLDCTEEESGIFYCNSTSELYQLSPGESQLEIIMSPDPRLFPTDYNFTLSVRGEQPVTQKSTAQSTSGGGSSGSIFKSLDIEMDEEISVEENEPVVLDVGLYNKGDSLYGLSLDIEGIGGLDFESVDVGDIAAGGRQDIIITIDLPGGETEYEPEIVISDLAGYTVKEGFKIIVETETNETQEQSPTQTNNQTSPPPEVESETNTNPITGLITAASSRPVKILIIIVALSIIIIIRVFYTKNN